MKQIVCIERFVFGHYDAKAQDGKEEKRPYARIYGLDGSNRKVVALAYGSTAKSLDREIDALLPEGQDVSDARLFVEMTGEVVKPESQPDKGRKRDPYFKVRSFSLPTGPALENRIMRHAAARASLRAREAAEKGDFEAAFAHLDSLARAIAAPVVNEEATANILNRGVEPTAAELAAQEAPTTDQTAEDDTPKQEAASVQADRGEASNAPVDEASEDPESAVASELSVDRAFGDDEDSPEAAAAVELGLNTADKPALSTDEKQASDKPEAAQSDPFAPAPRKRSASPAGSNALAPGNRTAAHAGRSQAPAAPRKAEEPSAPAEPKAQKPAAPKRPFPAIGGGSPFGGFGVPR